MAVQQNNTQDQEQSKAYQQWLKAQGLDVNTIRNPQGYFQQFLASQQQQPPQPTAPQANTLGNAIYSKQSAYDQPTAQLSDKQNLDIAAIGQTPLQYQGTFNQAFQGLGQPGQPSQDVVASGTRELADAYIDRVFEKTGKLPDANQVKDFVSSNLDSGFASQYIKGTLNRDQIKSQMVDPYIAANGLGSGNDPTGVEGRMNDLNSKLEQYYKGAGDYATTNINNEFNRQKTNVANDLAGAGLLSSGVSRYSLNDLEGQRGQANASAQATLASQKAAGQVDLSKTIENILAGQRGLQQGASQFQQNLNFSKNQYQNQLDYQNRSLDLASQLGRLQANAGGGWGAGAAGGAIGGATMGASFGPWGALAGGAGGALLGALGTKK